MRPSKLGPFHNYQATEKLWEYRIGLAVKCSMSSCLHCCDMTGGNLALGRSEAGAVLGITHPYMPTAYRKAQFK